MKLKNKIIFAAFFLTITIIVLSIHRYLHSPSFQARKLLNELRNYHTSPGPIADFFMEIGLIKNDDYRDEREIIEDIAALGPSIIPHLIEALNQDDDIDFKHNVVMIFTEIKTSDPLVIDALTSLLNEPDADEYFIMSIFDSLGYIGPPAESALLELIQHPDPKIQLLAARALARIPEQCQNPDIMRLSIEALNHTDLRIRLFALDNLYFIGKHAQPAIPALLQAYEQYLNFFSFITPIFHEIGDPALPILLKAARANRSPKPLAALMALAETDPNLVTPEFLHDLIEMLHHENEIICKQSIEILTELGPRAQPAIPSLIQLLDPNDSNYYVDIFRALCAINPTDPQVSSILNDSLQHVVIQAFIDGDLAIRHLLFDELPLFEPAAKKMVPRLIEMLHVSDETTKLSVCNALISIDPEGALDEVMPVLSDFLHSSDEFNCWVAMMYLAGLKSLAKDAIPDLKTLLKDERISIRLAAADALAQIDPQHSSNLVTEILLETIKNKRADFRDRNKALWTLSEHDLLTPQMIPPLLRILKEDNDDLRENAVEILSGFPAESQLTLPHLKRILKYDEDRSVRAAAADTILQLDPNHPDPDALDYIISAIMDEQPYSWYYPLSTLSELGPHAAPAVPALIEKLNAPRSFTRISAVETLAAIGPAAKDAIPHLQKLLHDPVKKVRQSAAAALKKIQK